VPPLTITETLDGVRLQLGGLAYGEGGSLQEAADDLVHSVRKLALGFRTCGLSASREVRADLETMNLLYELADVAAAGGDIRARLFA
jgi:hypothetical protein